MSFSKKNTITIANSILGIRGFVYDYFLELSSQDDEQILPFPFIVVGQASTTERMTDTTLRSRARDRAQPWLRMQRCKN